jgi:hypothetical protein
VYSSLLSLLAAPQQLKPAARVAAAQVLRCCVGQVYDSGPVDFQSQTGRQLLLSPIASSTSSSGGAGHPAHAAALLATAAALGAAARNAAVNVGAGALDFCLLEHFDREAAVMW